MKNREIKFRCWDKKEGKWLFGYDYPDLGGFTLFGEVVLMGELNSISLDRLNDIETMQFTGLFDKNGKEIYEGDVCTGHSDGDGIITWSDFDGGYDYRFKVDTDNCVGIWEVLKDIIVIGNIYETK